MFYGSLCHLWTCLSYSSLVLPLDKSIHSSLCCLWISLFTAACAASGRISNIFQQPLLPLDTSLLHQHVLSVFQQSVLPLDLSVLLYSSCAASEHVYSTAPLFSPGCLYSSAANAVFGHVCPTAACATPWMYLYLCTFHVLQQPLLPLHLSGL
jgi:hypothetical protein